jgi:hypothetical protein
MMVLLGDGLQLVAPSAGRRGGELLYEGAEVDVGPVLGDLAAGDPVESGAGECGLVAAGRDPEELASLRAADDIPGGDLVALADLVQPPVTCTVTPPRPCRTARAAT